MSTASQYGVTTPLLLQRAIGAMCQYVDENPAAVALCTTGGNDGPGRVLSDQLVQVATALVSDRVPGIPEVEIEVVARTAVGITLGMLSGYTVAGPARPLIQQELVYVLSAYLYARFPPPNDFTWTDPRARGAAVAPVRAATSPSPPSSGPPWRPTLRPTRRPADSGRCRSTDSAARFAGRHQRQLQQADRLLAAVGVLLADLAKPDGVVEPQRGVVARPHVDLAEDERERGR